MREEYGVRHAPIASLRIDDPAPDAALVTLDGRTVQLSDFLGAKPRVLIFGSFS